MMMCLPAVLISILSLSIHLTHTQATENPKQLFLLQILSDGEEYKSCKWLNNTTPEFRDIVCARDSPVAEGHPLASELCYDTCGVAPQEGQCTKKECTKRATEMRFKISNNICADSTINQGEDKFNCEDANEIVFPAYVIVSSAKDLSEVYFQGYVDDQEVIEVTNNGYKFPTDMSVVIKENKSGGSIYQSLRYHSSCSKDLFLGDTFGCMKLVYFKNEYGTFDCLPASCGDPDIPQCNICEDQDNDFTTEIKPRDTVPNRRLILDEFSSDTQSCIWLLEQEPCYIERICSEQAPSPEYNYAKDVCFETCDNCDVLCQIECTSTPFAMKFQVNGGSCPRSENKQEGRDGTFICRDEDPIVFPAHISIQSKKMDLYFEGVVRFKGDIITIENNGHELESEMMVEISSASRNKVYQTFQFATSCSPDSLFISDIFGGVKIISITTQTQGIIECPPKELFYSSQPIPCVTATPSMVPTVMPTYIPSSKPSYIPSSAPSTSPTSTPSLHPSTTPSWSPSYLPTQAPSSCSDLCSVKEEGDFKFFYKFKEKDGVMVPIVKSCSWMSKQQSFKRDQVCSLYDSWMGLRPAKDVCTTSCYRCPCSDMPSLVPTKNPTPQPTLFPVKVPTDTCVAPYPEMPLKTNEIQQIENCCTSFDEDELPPKYYCCALPQRNRPDYCECEQCDPYEDPNCPFECPPDVCEVRPELFYFKFSGGSCEDSDNSQPSKFTCDDKGTINKSRSYYLVFTSAKSDAEVYYEGWVSPGEVVTLKHNGKFQADMRVDIYAGKMKWMVQTLVYHSSCSQNLFNGDVFGGVTLMGFKSYYQHSLCRPTNCDKPKPDCDPDTDPDCEEPCEPTMCEARPDKFYFKLTGGSCDESANSQEYKFSCYEMGSYNDAKGKYLEFTDTSGYETYFKGFVIPDGTMKLVSPSYKFPADMRVRIYTAPNKKYMLQDIVYHSSCSKNLYTGDSFGAVTLVGFESDYQNVKCE